MGHDRAKRLHDTARQWAAITGHDHISTNGDVTSFALVQKMQNASWISPRASSFCRLYVLNVMK